MSVPNEKRDGGFEEVPITKQEPYTQPNAYELSNDNEQTITGSPRTSTDLTSTPSKNDLAESLDPVYAAKATVLNNALNEIGMGRYQWELFGLVAFGWASDNSWLIVTSLILAPVANEFNPSTPTFLTLAQNIGLCFGAFFWGFGCDIIGRKWAFNMTLGIAAVFGLAAAGSPTFAAVCVFDALWSVGVGGNLPVDSAIFLEFLPGSHQYLLVVLSTFWALAQLIANLVAWPLLGNFTCEQGAATCTKSENMGWRYYLLVMGGLGMVMFILRFFCFKLQEPPKYLMGKGRDEEAVRVVHAVAKKNGKTCDLTLEDLQKCENLFVGPTAGSPEDEIRKKMARSGESEKLDLHHVKALFCDKKTAWSTSLLIIIWGLIGLGFPLYNAFLPYIQASKGVEFGDGSTNTTYLYTVYIALAGIPGACTGAFLVELPRLGRKGALAGSTFMTGAFLVGSTFSTSSKALLGWNCAYCFSQNIMYAVLYASTPETFPTLHRGTGNALVGTANRIMGILAPVIAMVAGLEQSSPIVYTAAGLFGLASIITLFLPFETRGKMSM